MVLRARKHEAKGQLRCLPYDENNELFLLSFLPRHCQWDAKVHVQLGNWPVTTRIPRKIRTPDASFQEPQSRPAEPKTESPPHDLKSTESGRDNFLLSNNFCIY